MIIEILGDDVAEETREETNLAEHVPVVQFMSTMTTKMLLELVMQLQNILTINII